MKCRLRDLREEHEFTQSDVAYMLNITRQNYSRWETGELLIPLYHLNTLANIYNCSMNYIMGLVDSSEFSFKLETLDCKLIGGRLREVRMDNNLSLRKLANILNTSHSTLSVYENGKNLIIISFAFEIAKKFNISLDWLCGRSEIKKFK